MHRPPSILDQHYQTDIHRIWHCSTPPPELLAALADNGWLGAPQRALDLGCGLGTELAHLADRGVALSVGVDRSIAALTCAHHLHPTVQFVQADVLQLPFPQASFDVVLDRGCFHYLKAADRPRYASEVQRVLRPGGRFLLRDCLYAQGSRNHLTEPLLPQVFTGWRIVSLQQAPIPSDTREMIAFVTRLEHPQDLNPLIPTTSVPPGAPSSPREVSPNRWQPPTACRSRGVRLLGGPGGGDVDVGGRPHAPRGAGGVVSPATSPYRLARVDRPGRRSTG